ncbi:MAG: TIGR00296 family protein [Candidatus Heimdallarchaeota archaeon]
MFNQADGEFLVRIAREAIRKRLDAKQRLSITEIPPALSKKSGVFVTIKKKTRSGAKLRGCIGHIYPEAPLIEATIDSAILAATNDPRFPPMTPKELVEALIEVTILTSPEEIKVNKPSEFLEKIEIGRHGLIVESGFRKGILLPQVPVEWNWDVEEFLTQLCGKAGLIPDCWCLEDTKLYRFESEIFKELSPEGKIVRETLQH